MAHIGDELDTNLPNFLVVVLVRLKGVQERLRNFRLCQSSSLLESIPRLDRGYTRNNGNSDTSSTNGLHPVQEDIDIVEHLRKDEIGTGIDLFFEPLDLLSEFIWRKQLLLWEPSNGNVEVVAVNVSDVLHEINTVNETTFDGFPFFFSCWWVSTKSQDVTTTMLFGFLQILGK